MENVFETSRRIRLGIWGLGRGQAFLNLVRNVNIDVVAGCDRNAHMCEEFHRNCPDAFVTADEEQFLDFDMDAVLVSTYFFAHAEHAIRCLDRGKHVMCEVTSFFTPAEGVRLVEAVERSGKVYNLLENFPFTKENLYLRTLWREGFFGEFLYGEFDYVHECRGLVYRYLNGDVIQPGWTVHSWRSWLDYHYYNTHSLGPVMQITGLRPERITAFAGKPHLPGYPDGCRMNGAAPSLIVMSNGGLVRNLMGAMSGDSHARRIWGTRAAAEFSGYEVDTDEAHYLGMGSCLCQLRLKLGACGHSAVREVTPQWTAFGELANRAGHWGGDFWELYYFARQILTGEPAPWEIYAACDVTLAGIMAVRSESENGISQEIPDFRDRAVRDRYRNDHSGQERPFDPARIFPDGHDPVLTGNFTEIMSALFHDPDSGMPLVRKAFDGMKIFPALASAGERYAVILDVKKLLHDLPAISSLYQRARTIAQVYPTSGAASAILSMLANGDEKKMLSIKNTADELRRWLSQ